MFQVKLDGKDQYALLFLWDQGNGQWGWKTILGAPLGNGQKSGWLSESGINPAAVRITTTTRKLFFFQPTKDLAPELEFDAKTVWPLSISSKGSGHHHAFSGKTQRPDGAVHWRVSHVDPNADFQGILK
jgi:hypothetical protein